ncbi:RTA1-domain-containing protein [Mollisia scopiformis]|uniref:RTA1-domain-containing protein n=1 Tax=Mollisia scopiformis TaxID=149040 RepID=A0A194XJF8_MOLSC|nr:RTA1-domain-containing protein [Mollisia scopiformis]KUJ19892.1 RTA1-domain-containing protein [Mollisia scopiformis]
MSTYQLPHGGGFTNPNFPNPHGSGDARIIIYGYTPSLTLCILAIILFTLAFLTHLLQTLRYRLWSFIPLTTACLLETIGYIFRVLSSQLDPYRITFFVVQYFLIVTAPVLISASIYVCLTRIISWADHHGLRVGNGKYWVLRRKVILWWFISVDVVTTIVQVTGAGLIGGKTSKQEDPTTANNILLAGLAIQSFAFLIFLLLLVVIIVTILKDGEMRETINRKRSPFLGVLLVASVLVFLRTVFRLVETAEGIFGYLSTHEAFFGALEFAPVIVAVWLLAAWHPGRWPTRDVRRGVKA